MPKNKKSKKLINAGLNVVAASNPALAAQMRAALAVASPLIGMYKQRRRRQKKPVPAMAAYTQQIAPMADARRVKDELSLRQLESQIMKNKTDPVYNHSPAAAKCLTAFVDPWSSEAIGASIPSRGAGPSYKVRNIIRTSVTANTNGYGMVAIAPTTCNDATYALVSGFSWAGTALTNNPTDPGITAVQMDSLPFTIANNTTLTDTKAVSSRIVSVGYRITYTGTEANKGGVYNIISFPDREPIANLTVTTIGNKNNCNVRSIDRNRVSDVLFPINTHEIEYSNADSASTSLIVYPYSNGVAYSGTVVPVIAGILISGAASGSTFEVEIIQHTEIVGKGAMYMLSPYYADPQAFELIAAGMSHLEYNRPAMALGDSLPDRLATLRRYFMHIQNKGMVALIGQVSAALKGFGNGRAGRLKGVPDGLYSVVGARPFV